MIIANSLVISVDFESPTTLGIYFYQLPHFVHRFRMHVCVCVEALPIAFPLHLLRKSPDMTQDVVVT